MVPMTLHGHIQNGKVVLEGAMTLPEGAAVLVTISFPQVTARPAPASGEKDAPPKGLPTEPVFRPVAIRGEPLSATILSERR
jgi:hypothetical protein